MDMSKEIIEMIEAGDLDDNIAPIMTAFHKRNTVLAGVKKGFRRGDTVKITGRNLRPKYLFGKEFLVEKVNTKTVVVDFPFDPAYGRFSGASGVRIPKTAIEVVP